MENHTIHANLLPTVQLLKKFHTQLVSSSLNTEASKLEATAAVKKLMQDAEELSSRCHTNASSTTWHLSCVPPGYFGRLIGSKGSNIKELKRSFPSVHFQVPNRYDASAHVQLKGPVDDVRQAHTAICISLGLGLHEH